MCILLIKLISTNQTLFLSTFALRVMVQAGTAREPSNHRYATFYLLGDRARKNLLCCLSRLNFLGALPRFNYFGNPLLSVPTGTFWHATVTPLFVLFCFLLCLVCLLDVAQLLLLYLYVLICYMIQSLKWFEHVFILILNL